MDKLPVDLPMDLKVGWVYVVGLLALCLWGCL